MPFLPFPNQRRNGFTILELMIVVVLGSILLAGITSVIVSEVKASRNQLLAQQLRSDWNRLSTFLANEVGEGRRVRTTTTSAELTASGCTLPTGSSFLFSVTVPIATDNGNPVERSVYYYSTGTGTGTTLFRCGPPILSTGRLDTSSAATTARLLSGIPLSSITDANEVAITLCNYTTPACNFNASTAGAANIGPLSIRTRSLQMP